MTIKQKIVGKSLATSLLVAAVGLFSAISMLRVGTILNATVATELRETRDSDELQGAAANIDGAVDNYLAAMHEHRQTDAAGLKLEIDTGLDRIATAIFHLEQSMQNGPGIGRAWDCRHRLEVIQQRANEAHAGWSEVRSHIDGNSVTGTDTASVDRLTRATGELLKDSQDFERGAKDDMTHGLLLAQSRVTTSVHLLTIAAVVSIILAVGMGLLVAVPLSARLERLRDGTVEIGKGNFEALIKVQSDDEIGQLATAFNKMVALLKHSRTSQKMAEEELRTAHADSENLVQARTAELQQANTALRLSETNLHRAKDIAEAANRAKSIIFDTALDAIVTIDSRSIITEWNLQAETMFRWDRTEVIGLRLDETIIPQRQWDAHRREIEAFVQTGEGPLLHKVAELIALRRDGREFPVEIAITPAWSGGVCTFTAFIRDITARRQAESDLRHARDAAENASRAKSEFLANMSHEIRTPLNGVIGMSDLLLGTELDEKQRRFAELIKSSGASLADLINDILDFSKIEARKLEIESVEFDLYAAVEDVMETMLIKANPKGLDLGCLTLAEVPRQVTGDPQRVKQILINLVNNAIKFTESGSITTRLTLQEQSQECAIVRFSITDTGIGIPADRMDRLFKSFSQVDASTTRSFGGTGLGLAISKQLAELMGGNVGVESVVGHGSTFWFTIKVGLKPQTGETAVAIDSRGLRILAVHSDRAMREILREQLDSWHVRAAVAASGEEAISMLSDAAAEAHPYDVAIIDGELSDISTLDLGNAIKARPEIAATALLILLPWGADFDPLKLRKAGFSGHLLKPVRQSRLYNSIMDAMGSTPKTKLIAAEVVANTACVDQKINGAPAARILIVEDNRVNQIVATEVLTKHGYACDVVENGNKAIAAVFTERYDLVLMDCSMPGMDGFEATRQIRRAEKANPAIPPQHIPIIALTANAIKGDRDLCIEVGMDDYVSKPLDPDRLIKAIQTLLATSNRASSTDAPVDDLRATSRVACDETGPMAIDALLERCMGNISAALSILDEFEHEAISDLAQIKQRIETGDCAGLAHVAHSLKGAAAVLSANPLTGIALKLEQMGQSGVFVEQDELLSQLNHEIQRCVGYLPAARIVIAKGSKV